MSSPTSSPRTLTYSELDALPVGAAVRCTTERGMRVVLALKVGVPQGSGGHIWRTTEYSTVPGSFAIAHADAVLLEPVEPGHRAPDVQVDLDNPALAFAAAVQTAVWTCADQGPDVGNARHEPDVVQSRHVASRDIPSSAGGPATTPALDRADATYRAHRVVMDGDGAAPLCAGCDFVTPLAADGGWDHPAFHAHRIAATVSAALHDPDDPHWLAKELHAAQLEYLASEGVEAATSWDDEVEYIRSAWVRVADAARAAILGARGEEVSRG